MRANVQGFDRELMLRIDMSATFKNALVGSLLGLFALFYLHDSKLLAQDDRAQLVSQKESLGKSVYASLQNGRLEETAELAERLFGIEKKLCGGVSEDLFETASLLGQVYWQLKAGDKAVAKQKICILIAQELYGNEDWRSIDARLGLDDYQKLMRLDEGKRTEIENAEKMLFDGLSAFQAGAFAQAIQYFENSVRVQEKILGDSNHHVAETINKLAMCRMKVGDYSTVLSLLKKSLAIQQHTWGQNHPTYADTLNYLANYHLDIGEFSKAETNYLKAKEIVLATLGELDPLYSMVSNNLAMIHKYRGEYSKSESLYRKSIEIARKTIGEGDPEFAMVLNNLAEFYSELGDFGQAEPLYQKCKSILQKTIGESHPSFAVCLSNLASLYQSMGDYAKAESYYMRSQDVQRNTTGIMHPGYATTLNNLASLYESTGDLVRAEPLLTQAMQIRERIFGVEHPDYAISLIKVGSVRMAKGDLSQAEQLFLQAKQILKNSLGETNPNYGLVLGRLAAIYEEVGDDAEAEKNLKEVRKIYEEFLGQQHQSFAAANFNLGDFYLRSGDASKALPFFVDALEGYKQIFGAEHYTIATSLTGLSNVYHQLGEYEKAEAHSLDALKLTRDHLQNMAVILPDRQKLLLSALLRHRLDDYVLLALDEGDSFRNKAAKFIVAWKGSTLVRQRAMRKAAVQPEIADKFSQLQRIVRSLAKLVRSVPDQETLIGDWRRRVQELSAEKEMLEAQLSRASASYQQAAKQFNFAEFQNALPGNAVLLDFLEVRTEKRSRLVVSVVSKTAEPMLLDLGDLEAVNQDVEKWRKSYGLSELGKAAGIALRKAIWTPILPMIEDAETILISPDGMLGKLPFAALPGKKPDTYLLEDHRIAMVPVPQLLPTLVQDLDPKNLKHEMMLMGGVDFDWNPSQTQVSPAPERPRRRKRPSERSGNEEWKNLAASGPEVDSIAKTYLKLFPEDAETDKLLNLQKGDATESAFRQHAPNSYYLHLATHGFFAAPEFKSALLARSEAGNESQSSRLALSGLFEEVRGWNPGQLSGLVFAGANYFAENPNENSDDDGILTADEIAFLPLDGVKLAVLSACQTGLGEVAGGEGLLGIQRAFQVAGVDSTISTLWSISDPATRAIMERFYENFLDKEMTKLDALREAKLWAIRNATEVPRGSLEVRPEPSDRLSPKYWAPFILSGDWR